MNKRYKEEILRYGDTKAEIQDCLAEKPRTEDPIHRYYLLYVYTLPYCKVMEEESPAPISVFRTRKLSSFS